MDTNTKLLARLKVGFLIREIFARFTMKKDSTLTPNRVLWMYSAHDETIINVLNALNLFEVLKSYSFEFNSHQRHAIANFHSFVSFLLAAATNATVFGSYNV